MLVFFIENYFSFFKKNKKTNKTNREKKRAISAKKIASIRSTL